MIPYINFYVYKNLHLQLYIFKGAQSGRDWNPPLSREGGTEATTKKSE